MVLPRWGRDKSDKLRHLWVKHWTHTLGNTTNWDKKSLVYLLFDVHESNLLIKNYFY